MAADRPYPPLRGGLMAADRPYPPLRGLTVCGSLVGAWSPNEYRAGRFPCL